MSKRVLTAKFNYSIPTEELKIRMTAVSPRYANIPGCQWKLWLIDEAHKEAGGVYLFDSAAELESYLNSDLFAAVVTNPVYSNMRTNTYGLVEAASVITGAPLLNMNVQ